MIGGVSAAAGFPLAMGVILASPATPVADPCPTNETSQIYFDGCLPSIDPPQAEVNQRGPNQLPEIRGIPCDGSDSGTCIGLSELPGGTAAQPTEPDTQVRSSP
ncbi:hypothetical protein Y900_002005 [Mycolicibacterium aromaticivorans JS19b1 = JCM 16368]|uniref:Intersectin-EH binding protein Ibp1 n=1 Tax=Mycolicibacterium aromaticivorans JS19b1 = JCM 16368 TaxID=1440774 RepID=A0A064CBN8_9MYCO|nr:hypothetical protein Y900_002005 [Mycolicibacterium aromaticivorans JS19b1 = JCM 16368]